MQARLGIPVGARHVFLNVNTIEFRHSVLRHRPRQDERVAKAWRVSGPRTKVIAGDDFVAEIPVLPHVIVCNVCAELGRDEVARAARDDSLDHSRLELEGSVPRERDHDVEPWQLLGLDLFVFSRPTRLHRTCHRGTSPQRFRCHALEFLRSARPWRDQRGRRRVRTLIFGRGIRP